MAFLSRWREMLTVVLVVSATGVVAIMSGSRLYDIFAGQSVESFGPDIALWYAQKPASVEEGSIATYVVRVRNNGSKNARRVRVVLSTPFPFQMVFRSENSDPNCIQDPPYTGAIYCFGKGQNTGITLGPGGARNVQVSFFMDQPFCDNLPPPTDLTETLMATAISNPADYYKRNNTATATTTVTCPGG